MEQILSVVDRCRDLLSTEMCDAEELKDDKLRQFKSLFGINWETATIFYNSSSIIITSQEDYKRISQMPKFEKMFKIESEYFNEYIYVLSFLNNKMLENLLGV